MPDIPQQYWFIAGLVAFTCLVSLPLGIALLWNMPRAWPYQAEYDSLPRQRNLASLRALGWCLLAAVVWQFLLDMLTVRYLLPRDMGADWLAKATVEQATILIRGMVVEKVIWLAGVGAMLLVWLVAAEDAAFVPLYRLVGLGVPRFYEVIWGILFWLILCPPLLLLQSLLIQFFPQLHPLMELLKRLKTTAAPGAFLGLFTWISLSVVIMAPLTEELLFRGLLQNWLRRRLAVWSPPSPAIDPNMEQTEQAPRQFFGWERRLNQAAPAIVLTSLVFALMHLGQGPAPIPIFFLSLGLGLLFELTGRLWPGIVVHLMLNLTSTILLWLELQSLK
ncbi:MAG: CPBP family intramembrane glutamic endopeptidase [Pirellulales bacterium]|nr:CPBP family intramembrane glutamic endopeptidase [Pirellulales bacterium]